MSVSRSDDLRRWRQRMGSDRGGAGMLRRQGKRGRDGIVFGIRWEGGRPPRLFMSATVAALVAALAPAAAQARETLVVPTAGHGAQARALVTRLGGHPGHRIGIAGGFAASVPAN